MAGSWRFLTVDQARALECNGCGDCCDPTKVTTNFGWGPIPQHQYRGLGGGQPLIIPLEQLTNGSWVDVPWQPEHARNDSIHSFRCAAHQEGGGCSLYDKQRPSQCSLFPVWFPAETLVGKPTKTLNLQRCTWFGVIIIADDDPLRPVFDPEGNYDWDALNAEQQDAILALIPSWSHAPTCSCPVHAFEGAVAEPDQQQSL